MRGGDTEEMDIPDGLDEVVARFARRTISGWRVGASCIHSALCWWEGGCREPMSRPPEAGWFVASPESVAARLRFQHALDVRGDEEVDAIRQLMPWIDSSYDLVTTSRHGTRRDFTFWQTSGYEPVPAGTYQLECWYAATDVHRRCVFGWKVVTEGPAQGRVIHQAFDLEPGPNPEAWRSDWSRLKHVLKVLDIYERDYPYFPGFNTVGAEGKRVVADVTVDAVVEDYTGVTITHESIQNVRRWLDPARATFLQLVP